MNAKIGMYVTSMKTFVIISLSFDYVVIACSICSLLYSLSHSINYPSTNT